MTQPLEHAFRNKSMLSLTIQKQHKEVVVETSRYLFELSTCFDSFTSLHQGLEKSIAFFKSSYISEFLYDIQHCIVHSISLGHTSC